MGIDVTESRTGDLHSSEDNFQWEYAKRENRVMITHDDDFLKIAKVDYDHSGIVFSKQKGHSLAEIIILCSSIHSNKSPDKMRSNIEFV